MPGEALYRAFSGKRSRKKKEKDLFWGMREHRLAEIYVK